MSFFIKSVVTIAAILSLVAIIYFTQASKIDAIEKKESSELKQDALEVLQKLVNSEECLSYTYENTTRKGELDIMKIYRFAIAYPSTEPRPAKALNFDYHIEIVQSPKDFTLYSGETTKITKEVMLEYICTARSLPNDEFIFASCNYNPVECPGVCDSCNEFDIDCRSGRCKQAGNTQVHLCDPSWGCGNDPLHNCPYTGSCTTGYCPGGKPPNGVCCIWLQCPKDACEYVINAPLYRHPVCWVAYGECDLSKCREVAVNSWLCAHCTKGVIEIPQPSAEVTNISIPMKTWGFGVGFGTSEFSPHAAKKEEIELILPITIRYNETTSREGQIKITAVRGELESLTGLIEDVCIKAEENPGEEIVISRDMFFTYPVEYDRTKLCMVDSCKKVDCNLPIKFEDIKRKGEYYVEISYSSGIINVRT